MKKGKHKIFWALLKEAERLTSNEERSDFLLKKEWLHIQKNKTQLQLVEVVEETTSSLDWFLAFVELINFAIQSHDVDWDKISSTERAVWKDRIIQCIREKEQIHHILKEHRWELELNWITENLNFALEDITEYTMHEKLYGWERKSVLSVLNFVMTLLENMQYDAWDVVDEFRDNFDSKDIEISQHADVLKTLESEIKTVNQNIQEIEETIVQTIKPSDYKNIKKWIKALKKWKKFNWELNIGDLRELEVWECAFDDITSLDWKNVYGITSKDKLLVIKITEEHIAILALPKEIKKLHKVGNIHQDEIIKYKDKYIYVIKSIQDMEKS